jgi:fused signal recognition particle receptor
MLKFLKEKWKGFVQNWKAQIGQRISSIFSKKIDDKAFLEFEKLLIEADLGVALSMELVDKVKKEFYKSPNQSPDEILAFIKKELISSLTPPQEIPLKSPHIIMMVGINGSGKTTSVAKLAHYYQKMGKKVLMCAADTFRAAAVEQLTLWADKLKIDLIKSQSKADPSSVVYDSIQAAIARKADIVIIDVAGRLHTKTDLMQELKKMKSVAQKLIPSSPHEILLTIDATSGQNGIDQAKIFNSYTPLTGLIITKMDGTAKGGIAIAIQKELKLPIYWIGIGEKENDLIPFDPEQFIQALLS